MMQYLMKIKYKGNPNPMNSSCFELFKRGTSFLMMGLRQQGQKMLEELGLRMSSTRPGLLALACSCANFQSGGIMSRSIMCKFLPTYKMCSNISKKGQKKTKSREFKGQNKEKYYEMKLGVKG